MIRLPPIVLSLDRSTQADITAVAVVALTEDGHQDKEYLITGPEGADPGEGRRAVEKVLGREIHLEGADRRADDGDWKRHGASARRTSPSCSR